MSWIEDVHVEISDESWHTNVKFIRYFTPVKIKKNHCIKICSCKSNFVATVPENFSCVCVKYLGLGAE